MNIWILAKTERFDNYENTRFQEVAAKLGINLTMISPDDCEILATHDDRKNILIAGQEVTDLPDCLIPRTGSGTNYFSSAVIRQFEQLGVHVLNTSRSIEIAKDKLETVQTLAVNNLPIPNTILAKFPLDLDLIEEQFSYPLLIKKVSSSEGKGIVLCQNRSQLSDIADLIKTSSNVIIQECITDSLGRDIRAFVIGGRVIGSMLRTAHPSTFKANYSAGGTVCAFETTPEVEWLALESARLMGLDIAGVDLLFDGEGFRICEVNSAPYFGGFEEATGIDVPQAVFDFVRVRQEGTATRPVREATYLQPTFPRSQVSSAFAEIRNESLTS